MERNRQVHYGKLDDMADLPGILKNFGDLGVELVVVSGGDGTVQAVITEIMEGGHFAAQPRLAVLPRGMTNMIADDVGIKNASARTLAHLIDQADKGELQRFVVKRHTLCVEAAPGRPALHGMFFGTSGIYRAIESCRRDVHSMKLESSFAVGATFASLAVQWLLGIGRKDGVFRGDRIAMEFDGGERVEGDYMALMATTLDRLVLGSRPYWGDGSGGLKVTSIAHPPRALARYTYRLMYGGERRVLPDDYQSRSANRLSLSMSCPFTLDGELFEASVDQPVVLSSGGTLEFVRL